ncbi:hypothetical protein DV451_004105 [Geotrichum candidum]|uniref:anthranilate synthase n=1 Tax=Geotrichum candidum TaxID=1173061 RepID=A0A0J9XER7_GEOCN|nr:hypothetical protein DV451_004105 [Geotrichum candidum]KAI9210930.1 hypothetical protein DS838_004201 [Geotrichum bryndzae]KAF5109625.1 hypothetical protein DV452_004651 [Geotrichum candidum]KAF5110089.1 hypothetical protein DV453_001071 [Geotrichum candidum]KAF5118622.1 hypothetical protein DV454_000449 [Geotrichum candidum]
MAPQIQPSLDSIKSYINDLKDQTDAPNLYPIHSFLPALDVNPHVAYLRIARPGDTENKPQPSFLFESTLGGENLGRYSFIGSAPRKTIITGNGHGPDVDPLDLLEEELSQFRQVQLPSIPSLSGGAIGYVGYDCVRYFEPKTLRENQKDPINLPEAALMLFDTVIAFDHVFQKIQIIHNIHLPTSSDPEGTLEARYQEGIETINKIADILQNGQDYHPPQPPIVPNAEFTSNIGQKGYEDHVRTLKEHILKGDIIQAVPSQRVARPTSLHPYNIYRHLRTVNPSPYLFYIDYLDFQIVGASPELLVKSEKGRIITHPIAGTVPRGKTLEEDNQLAHQLENSAKDRAEHVMLVDLARNDINRVCDPLTTNVDRLLTLERFSHVTHLVSQVSGVLRKDKTRFDAFRSIFPAGTVSGAPKVRAMELIADLENERRGVYAGAVGHWGYDKSSMDTCIALRTMVVKNGVAYLQAGGGIVYDSDPYDEYIETMNKMKANNTCIREAEEIWYKKQQESKK